MNDQLKQALLLQRNNTAELASALQKAGGDSTCFLGEDADRRTIAEFMNVLAQNGIWIRCCVTDQKGNIK